MIETFYFRLLSCIVTLISIHFIFKGNTLRWVNLYQGMLLAHYLLAIYYSKKSLIGNGQLNKIIILSFVIIISLISYLYFPNFIFFCFGIHYAIGEAYSHFYLVKKDDQHSLVLRSFFHFFLYLNAFQFNTFQIQAIEKINLTFFIDHSLSVSLSLFALILLQTFIKIFKGKEKVRDNALLISLDILFILISIAISKTQLPFIISIFYHIFFWFIISIFKSFSYSKDKMRFITTTLLVNTFFIIISLIFTTKINDMFNVIDSRNIVDKSLFLLGFFHIYSSLLNTNLNPSWKLNLRHKSNALQ